MPSRYAAQNKVAIVGYGQTEVQRRSTRPLGSLQIEAVDKAIEDAGLTRADIDGVSTYPVLPGGGGRHRVDGLHVVTSDFVAEHMGIKSRWLNNFDQSNGQVGASLIHAANAVAAGAADCVVVPRALHNPGGSYHFADELAADGPRQWTFPYGQVGAPADIAFTFSEYMQRYGASKEEIGTLVVQVRKNVQRIPQAYWHGAPITLDDYMQARVVADPVSILDCDIPLDVAAAFVVTSAERARDLPHKPVYVAGFVQVHQSRAAEQRGYGRRYLTLDERMESGLQSGKILWEMSGLKPSQVDVPQLYDGFSILTLLWLETLGFCPVGEAHNFIQDGAIDAGGSFPLLSGGGNLGNGRAHGIAHIRECYLQLSGRAGERQLEKATVGISSHSFPNWGAALLYSAEPVS